MASTRVGTCAICGDHGEVTTEHLPPKAVYNKPYPPNLPWVPACRTCNSGASSFDQRFAVYLSMAVSGANERGAALWKTRGLRTLGKNYELAHSILRGIEDARNARHLPAPPADRARFLWPRDVFQQVSARLSRGIYWQHTGSVLGDRVWMKFDAWQDNRPEMLDGTQDFIEKTIGNNEFWYRFAWAAQAPLRSLLVFGFHDGQWGSVETIPNGEACL